MNNNSMRRLAIIGLAVFLIAGFFLVNSSAQRRRKRRSSAPRITNPAIYQPSPSDNTNSNTTGTGEETASPEQISKPSRSASEDPEAMKQTIRTLSTQVDKLTDKITRMEEAQRSLVDLERLSRAEQRAAQLRAELRDVQTKEADLQAHAEDVDYALRPENIERATAGYGTTHPEELREQRRRQLESEKERVRKQLDQLAASRTRLEQAIAAADVETERLRQRLDDADAAALKNAESNVQTGGGTLPQTTPAAPASTPTPTPYPTP